MVNNSGWLVVIGELRNIIVVIIFIIRMLAYSAKNSNANGPAAYSTLKPDTSSDSPSVRSNGDRFVSARVEIYHIIINGHEEKTSSIGS